MEVQDIRLHRVAVPRVYRTRVAPMGGHADGKSGSTYVLIEMMVDGGAVGIGEISDVEPDWGTVDWNALGDTLNDALSGRSATRRHDAVSAVAASLPDLHRELRAGVLAATETALIDAAARIHRVPFYELLGGQHRDTVPVSWVAYIRGTGDLEEEIREKVDAGFRAFKLKVGEDHALDIERVKLARTLAGPDTHVRLDASGEWSEADAPAAIADLADAGGDAIETPIQAVARSLAKNHPEQVSENAEDVAAALARVKAAVSIPIIEHVSDFDDRFALALAAQRAVDAFNVLPGQAGGPSRALRLLHIAEAAEIDGLLGSTVELSPGTAAALHVGVAARGLTMASDLVGPGLLSDDVCVDPLAYEGGALKVTTRSGLGLELDPEKLASLRVGDQDG